MCAVKLFLSLSNHKNEKLFSSEKAKNSFGLLTCMHSFRKFAVFKISMDMDYVKKERTPRCLECGDEIVYGRKDKKFCSEECRHKHHNDLHRSCRHYKRMVAAILEKNYDILDDLVRSGIKAIWVADAVALGYNPSYVTSYRKHGKRSMCHCYDICYVATDNRMTSLSKIQNLSLPSCL